jgi:hypothetical protein
LTTIDFVWYNADGGRGAPIKKGQKFFEKTFQKVLTILSVCAIIRPWKGDNPFKERKLKP